MSAPGERSGAASRARELLSSALPAAGLGLACAAATLAAGPLAAPVHDAISVLARAEAGAPAAVLVEVEPATPAASAAAAAAARAAGAVGVWAALPAGHPLLGGARPGLDRVPVDADGFVRTTLDDGAPLRLPLPEALDRALALPPAQLAAGRVLAGQHAVLTFPDPAVGAAVLVPGAPGPVDASEVLAVALGTPDDRALQPLPLPLAAVLVAGLAAGLSLGLRRSRPAPAALTTAAALVVAVTAAVAARRSGLLLPAGGVLLAVAAAGLARLVSVHVAQARTVQELSLLLGGGDGVGGRPPSLEDLVEMARILAPGAAVVAWDQGGRRVHGGGPGSEELVAPDPLPGRPAGPPEAPVLPVRRAGRLVGALTVARRPAPTAAERAALYDLVALEHPFAPRGRPRPAPSSDPVAARLSRLQAGAAAALARTTRWEALLRQGPVTVGLFDLAGRPLVLGAGLRRLLPEGHGPALLRLVEEATGLDRARASMLLQDALAVAPGGPPVVRGLSRDLAGWELVLRGARVPRRGRREEGPVEGVVVALQDARGHARLAEARATALGLAGRELGRVTTALRTAVSSGQGSRRQLLADLDRLDALRAHLADLADASADADPEVPLSLERAVRAGLQALPADQQGQVVVQLVDCPAVRVRVAPFARALAGVLGDLLRHGGAVVVRARAGADAVALHLEEQAGGLPDHMARALIDEDSGAWPVVQARRSLRRMGADLETAAPAVGPADAPADAAPAGLVLTLPYF